MRLLARLTGLMMKQTVGAGRALRAAGGEPVLDLEENLLFQTRISADLDPAQCDRVGAAHWIRPHKRSVVALSRAADG